MKFQKFRFARRAEYIHKSSLQISYIAVFFTWLHRQNFTVKSTGHPVYIFIHARVCVRACKRRGMFARPGFNKTGEQQSHRRQSARRNICRRRTSSQRCTFFRFRFIRRLAECVPSNGASTRDERDRERERERERKSVSQERNRGKNRSHRRVEFPRNFRIPRGIMRLICTPRLNPSETLCMCTSSNTDNFYFCENCFPFFVFPPTMFLLFLILPCCADSIFSCLRKLFTLHSLENLQWRGHVRNRSMLNNEDRLVVFLQKLDSSFYRNLILWNVEFGKRENFICRSFL